MTFLRHGHWTVTYLSIIYKISSSLMYIIVSSVSVTFSFPVKVLPVNECNWHPFSIVPFVNTDHIFSSSLIMLFFINCFVIFMNMTLLFN